MKSALCSLEILVCNFLESFSRWAVASVFYHHVATPAVDFLQQLAMS